MNIKLESNKPLSERAHEKSHNSAITINLLGESPEQVKAFNQLIQQGQIPSELRSALAKALGADGLILAASMSDLESMIAELGSHGDITIRLDLDKNKLTILDSEGKDITAGFMGQLKEKLLAALAKKVLKGSPTQVVQSFDNIIKDFQWNSFQQEAYFEIMMAVADTKSEMVQMIVKAIEEDRERTEKMLKVIAKNHQKKALERKALEKAIFQKLAIGNYFAAKKLAALLVSLGSSLVVISNDPLEKVKDQEQLILAAKSAVESNFAELEMDASEKHALNLAVQEADADASFLMAGDLLASADQLEMEFAEKATEKTVLAENLVRHQLNWA